MPTQLTRSAEQAVIRFVADINAERRSHLRFKLGGETPFLLATVDSCPNYRFEAEVTETGFQVLACPWNGANRARDLPASEMLEEVLRNFNSWVDEVNRDLASCRSLATTGPRGPSTWSRWLWLVRVGVWAQSLFQRRDE